MRKDAGKTTYEVVLVVTGEGMDAGCHPQVENKIRLEGYDG